MKIYPYNYPLILNDEIFTEYGGKVLESTPQLRNACYLIAEQQVSEYLDTLLLPTTLTGTVQYTSELQRIVATDYGYVSALLWVRVLDGDGVELRQLNTSSSFGVIQEDTYGYLFVQELYPYPQLCEYGFYSKTQAYQLQYAYIAGLPTGTANQPGILTALSQAAQLVLNELQAVPANESTGDVGVTEYTSLDYHEKRKNWKNTIFGSSPKSAWIAKILDGTVKKARRSVMIGR